MTTDPEAALAPAGYVLAGKVSDFMPLMSPLSQTAEALSHDDHANSEGDLASTTACPAVVSGDCSVKGEGKDAHLIKVVEIPQPAGRYPPIKRVAVSYFHSKWTFDALSGQSDSTRFVVDTFDVKELDGFVYVSEKPRNIHVAGPRRDFGGRELN
ncbi:hypothetical protein BGZ93_007382 [Podila epicladia]|nr:hypothetical protein BGZ92_007581 [Podila epicladia]KAG0094313.1 hypothetical protein BGZ93_007382 [Podila epicladia]